MLYIDLYVHYIPTLDRLMTNINFVGQLVGLCFVCSTLYRVLVQWNSRYYPILS